MTEKRKEKERERKRVGAETLTSLIKPSREVLTTSADALPNVGVQVLEYS